MRSGQESRIRFIYVFFNSQKGLCAVHVSCNRSTFIITHLGGNKQALQTWIKLSELFIFLPENGKASFAPTHYFQVVPSFQPRLKGSSLKFSFIKFSEQQKLTLTNFHGCVRLPKLRSLHSRFETSS